MGGWGGVAMGGGALGRADIARARRALSRVPPTCRSAGETIELIFLISFTIEMVIKIVAEGFLMHRHAYLRSGWCPPPPPPTPPTPS